MYVFWFVAALIDIFIIIAALFVAVFGNRSTAAGMAAGFAVGVLILSSTCFVNLSTFSIA